MLFHLLKSTLHFKANDCSIGTFIRFYMQSALHSKANACNIGTFIKSNIQMWVEKNPKAFAYKFYRPFTQQCRLPFRAFCQALKSLHLLSLQVHFNENIFSMTQG